ncbi:MAG: tRNA pseudouridine(55) synthase TruB [Ignavibacteriales bacterium]|nr:tRNA pseudouridine(55) synthase TruB [Ignavibacteriales bacterium]
MLLKKNWDFNGSGEMILVDKPLDWTSMDVVKKVRSLFHVNRAGHAGTLDPKAGGLLIVCTGPMTKRIEEFMGLAKEYEGTLQLGIQTPSFDVETEVTERKDVSELKPEDVRLVMTAFVGRQRQTPPMYSAAKFGGKPLYKYARRGRVVERAPRDIEIRQFEPVRIEIPVIEFRAACSKGTYVRSLVNDLGQKLGCGACLTSLRRTRIGEYRVGDAATIEELVALAQRLRTQQFSRYEAGVPA